MKHIIKKSIVCLMILGLTLPTNAAVSVTDGSSFITKTQHSTDINNLSSRISQLENSLGTRIDNIITKYLASFNTMWRGEKQTILKKSQDMYRFQGNGTTLFGPFTVSEPLHMDSHDFIGEAIQINKSGLAFIKFSLIPKVEPPPTLYIKFYQRTYRSYLSSVRVGISVNRQGSNGLVSYSDQIASVSISTGSSLHSWQDTSGYTEDGGVMLYVPIPWGTHTVKGMVNKGDVLYFLGVLTITSYYNLKDAKNQKNEYNKASLYQTSGLFTFTVEDCTVY